MIYVFPSTKYCQFKDYEHMFQFNVYMLNITYNNIRI
jgi:hypothetical protein